MLSCNNESERMIECLPVIEQGDEQIFDDISSTDRCYYVGMKVKKYGCPYFDKYSTCFWYLLLRLRDTIAHELLMS